MTPVTAISYAMWAVLSVAMLVVLWGGPPLVRATIASGTPGALTMWGSEWG